MAGFREKLKKLIGQGVKFALVGAMNTLIDLGVFTLLTLIAFFAQNYIFAKMISFSCGVANSLFMNKRFTFREKGRMGAKRVLAFVAINLVSLGVSLLVLAFAVERIGMREIWGNAVSVVFSMGVNFVLNKVFVFRD